MFFLIDIDLHGNQTFIFCLWISLIAKIGVRTQVATAGQAIVEETQKVEGPVVVVTGASRGIGKAVALALGKAGCKVGKMLCAHLCVKLLAFLF